MMSHPLSKITSTRLLRRTIVIGSVLCLSVTMSGCALSQFFTSSSSTTPPAAIPEGASAVPAQNRAVLADNTEVTASTGNGIIKIEAGPGLRRIFTWKGKRRGVITKARTEPFGHDQALGLTFNGKPDIWPEDTKVKKLRYEEGYWDFETESDAYVWAQIRRPRFVYNSTGLAVGWRGKGDTLHVEVWQFLIDGKKPTHMRGAHDRRIIMGPET